MPDHVERLRNRKDRLDAVGDNKPWFRSTVRT
jgi:hypothetical protein